MVATVCLEIREHAAVAQAQHDLADLVETMNKCPPPPTTEQVIRFKLSVWRFPPRSRKHRERFFVGMRVRSEDDNSTHIIFPFEDIGLQEIKESADMKTCDPALVCPCVPLCTQSGDK